MGFIRDIPEKILALACRPKRQNLPDFSATFNPSIRKVWPTGCLHQPVQLQAPLKTGAGRWWSRVITPADMAAKAI